jgi:dipeptidyl-peptidase-4
MTGATSRIAAACGALAVLAGCATAAARPSPASGKRLTTDRIFSDPDLSGSLASGVTWLPDGSAYAFNDHGAIVRVDAATGARTTWADADSFTKSLHHAVDESKRPNGRGGLDGFDFLPDGRSLVAASAGDLWRFDLASRKWRPLTSTPESEQNVSVAPDGSRAAFVREFDLWTIDLKTDAATRLTDGGTADRTHGLSDWVYDEELGVAGGYWWSPDSSRIAYLDIDETPVPKVPIVDSLPTHPTVEWQRYPKAGDPNPVVRVGVVAATGGATTWIYTAGAASGYVARVDWTPDGKSLLVQVLDRAQTNLTMLRCDPATGKSAVLFEETSSAWVDVHDDLRVLKDGRILWKSARTGFDHLWLLGADGHTWTQLTSGKWNVDAVAGLDEDAGFVSFTANTPNPRETNLYRVRLDGTGLARVTPDAGCHSVSMPKNAKWFLDTWSDVSHPARRDLRRADGSLVATVEGNACEELAKFRRASAEFVEIATQDGVTLQGQWIKPADFDPKRRYPVLVAVYGGPLSRAVSDSWGGRNRLWYEMLADRGILVLTMDNRAAAPHGIGVAGTIRGRLGTVELADELQAVKYLRSLPYVDGDRLAVWGWSYGGYMAAYSILNAPDAFRAAVAVAPVTDWRDYDTIYTERYMGLPKDNAEGYAKAAPVTAAANLRGRLLLVHGTSDDNVHLQNTMQLADALVRAGRPFRLMTYPAKKHGISGTEARKHLFAMVTEFLTESLDVPPAARE